MKNRMDNRRQSTDYIIVHSTGREFDFPLLIKMRHKLLMGWEDIGFHYIIGNGRMFTENGKIYTGRPADSVGTHLTGYNINSLTICLIGDFDRNYPNPAQTFSLLELLADKMKQYHIPLANVIGHDEIPGVIKSCPGKKFNMTDIRELISMRYRDVIPELRQ
jgi:N-acetylmuramoyl-L-alanine amidase